jgi:hypothetical protein
MPLAINEDLTQSSSRAKPKIQRNPKRRRQQSRNQQPAQRANRMHVT